MEGGRGERGRERERERERERALGGMIVRFQSAHLFVLL